jgi:hypothetical protein
MPKSKPKLKDDERFCEKCKEVVDKINFNAYYEICHNCESKSTGH